MESSKKLIRTAIIGYGESGRLSHGAGLRANAEFEIAAICDVSGERREEAAKEHGCATYSEHREMLEAEELDLVSIVTRSDTHCDMACDCLRAGVDTLVTKPWVLNTEEADKVMAAHRSSGKHLFPWVPMYWAPDFTRISQLIESNAIGEVFLIRRYITAFWRRNSWQTERRYGGGYLLNWGMHIVQPVLALAGSRVRRVYGQLQRVINPGDADDNFIAVMEFANGVRGVAEFTEAIEGLPMFLAQGKLGMIRSDENEVVLLQKDPAGCEEAKRTVFPITGKIFRDEADIYRDVARTLLNDEPFQVTPEIAYYGTVVLDALLASHESGQSVILAERPPVIEKIESSAR